MKWLQSAPQTKRLLRSWAGEQKLCIESFYFWYNGTDLQRSYIGLLRTLLYQLLRQFPSTIGRLSNEFRSEVLLHTEQPSNLSRRPTETTFAGTEVDFLRQLGDAILQVSPDARLCFFIDGLDEYDGHKEEMIKVLRKISDLPNVKTCVSSRPWTEFEEAFSGDETQNIVLHKHNMADIRAYATETLESHTAFARLAEYKTEFAEIIETLVHRAKGVFFWVFFIVKSLEDGISNRDLIEELKLRVERFPPNLTEFFQRMLVSIDPEYHETSSRILLMLLHGRSSLPVLTFQYISEARSPEPLISNMDPWDESALRHRSRELVQPRLKARCKDLIDIFDTGGRHHWASRLHVDLLHRTIFDFLSLGENRQILKARAGQDFQADHELCMNTVPVLKLFSPPRVPIRKQKARKETAKAKDFSYQDGNDCFVLVKRIVECCREVAMQSGVMAEEILNEAETVIHTFPRALRDQIATNCSLSPDFLWETQDLILAPSIEAGFLAYVEHRFQVNKAHNIRVRGNLSIGTALDLAPVGHKAEIIRIMLQNGAQVTEKCGGFEFWTYYLRKMRNGLTATHLTDSQKDMIRQEEFTQVVLLLVQHGADVYEQIELRRDIINEPAPGWGSRSGFPMHAARSSSTGPVVIPKLRVEQEMALDIIAALCSDDDYELILKHAKHLQASRSKLAKIWRGFGLVLRAIGTP